jgi:hypothetical protein
LWLQLASGWTEEPTLNVTTPTVGGEVYDYTFGAVIYYRHIPVPYDSTRDAFYENYAGGILSTLLTTKGLVI